MTTDLDALEAIAKAATPGPWRNVLLEVGPVDGPAVADVVTEDENPLRLFDAEFIAAADPSTILALIAELRQERERADEVTREYELILTRQGVRVVMAERGAAVAALSRAEKTIEKALGVVQDRDGDPAGRIERLLRAENILTDYDKQKGQADG